MKPRKHVCCSLIVNLNDRCRVFSPAVATGTQAGSLSHTDVGVPLNVSFPTVNGVAGPQLCAAMLCRLFKMAINAISTVKLQETSPSVAIGGHTHMNAHTHTHTHIRMHTVSHTHMATHSHTYVSKHVIWNADMCHTCLSCRTSHVCCVYTRKNRTASVC